MIWAEHFKKPLTQRPDHWEEEIDHIEKYFMSCEWYEVYDLIEFIAQLDLSRSKSDEFVYMCNHVLERELSGYRFVGSTLTPLTSSEEIESVEKALTSSDAFSPVSEHLKKALQLLSNRDNPDYPNSIKEAISAVEAACNIIVGSDDKSLGKALKSLEKVLPTHKAFRTALDNLYGYTSGADGIRHFTLDTPQVDVDDAKFMLVSCAAFTNYLKAKAARAGILAN